MRQIARRWVLVVAVGALAAVHAMASATDVYISQASAGSADGSSCANAKVYSYFNSSANWGTAAGKIGPGTTTHVCGVWSGSAGQSWLTVQQSGASGSPVTIKFEAGAAWRAPYHSSAGAIYADGMSYIVFDGINIQNTGNGTGLAYQQPSMGIQAFPCVNCELKNSTFANFYVHSKCEAASGCDVATDNNSTIGLLFGGANWSIHDNIFHDIHWILQQRALNGDTATIYNNEFYHMDHGIACGGGPQVVVPQLTIYGNHFHDMDNWDTGVADAYHHDGIHCFSTLGSGKVQNIYIHDNVFDGNAGNCCVTAWIFLEGGTSSGSTPWTDATGTAYVWNNVITSTGGTPYSFLVVDEGTGHLIANNTIIGPSDWQNACITMLDAANFTIVNNAIQDCGQILASSTGKSFKQIDYNVYANSRSGNPLWNFQSMSGDTLPQWQAACRCDAHSLATLSTPLAMTPAGVPTAGYIGTGVGLNLSSLAVGPLASLSNTTTAAISLIANLRPSSGWDIGAYPASTASTSTRPNPPTTISVSVHRAIRRPSPLERFNWIK